MEFIFYGDSIIDYAAFAAWVIGLLGVTIASSQMRRHPQILIRVGLLSAVMLILSPVVLLWREPIWAISLFVIVNCAISYGMWRRYRKITYTKGAQTRN